MKNLWNKQEADQVAGDLAQRVYTSRLLGCEPALVLHGGGNTSVKLREKKVLGDEEDILHIKGSGRDLATIDATGFAPCRLQHLRRVVATPGLSEEQVAGELKASVTNPAAPFPSVETFLHAVLPAKYVDHTHADAVLAIMNTATGEQRIRELYGDRVVVVPYVRSGIKLARLCAESLQKQGGPQTTGLALMHHGLVTFGETAQQAYERMIDLVTQAEQYLDRHGAWQISIPPVTAPAQPLRQEIAQLRREISAAAGAPVVLMTDADPRSLAFARRDDVAVISQQGPVTPDHVIRTKRVPLVGRDVAAYRAAYEQYFEAHARQLPMVDAAPRVILDPELGMCTAGRTARDATIARDIYRHTIEIILRATALGGYQPPPAKDIFEVEYWDLEQAKLDTRKQMFTGEVALVTGAASGIGKACAESFLKRGAAVVGLDINPAVAKLHDRPDYAGFACDLTDESQVLAALEQAVRAFGGLDILILNAGIFPPGCRIDALETSEWRRVMQINLDANLVMMRECHPLLKLAPNGGRAVVIGSKNVPAPGPGAAAYSTSKAALNQLARVAALEWCRDKIRVNSLHPQGVFDTNLWTKELLTTRAKHYGMSIEEYKRNNLLKVEVTAHDVAELAAELCGPLFAKTTGSQVPVDGGLERVI